MNGCNNRKPLDESIQVQDGWERCGVTSRLPIMKVIPNPMTKECQYQKLHKNDSGCKGCKWLT